MNASLSSLFRPRALVIDSARAPLDSALAMRPAPLNRFEILNGDRYYCAGKSLLTHFVMKHH